MFRGWYYFRNFANRNLKLEFSVGNSIMNIEEECKKNNIIIITSATTFEIMNIYNSIKEKTDDAIKIAQTYEKQCLNNNEGLYKKNPHTSIYKIIEVINSYNNTQK